MSEIVVTTIISAIVLWRIIALIENCYISYLNYRIEKDKTAKTEESGFKGFKQYPIGFNNKTDNDEEL